MPETVADRIRKICLSLPATTEKESHGAPAFFVKKQFLMLWAGGHHDHESPHLWCAAPPGVQEELVATNPDRFFRPPYVGHRGRLGIRLDRPVDWDELTDIIEDAYRSVAPRRVIDVLDERGR